MSSTLLQGFSLGPWKVEPLRGVVSGPKGETHHLEPKVMDVFVCLAEQSNELVARDQLLETVWSGTVGSDAQLTRAIGELRRAFENDRDDSMRIETVPKRGYRLIGQVCLLEGIKLDKNGTPRSAAAVLSARRPATRHRILWAAGVSLVAVLAVLVGLNVGGLRDQLLGGPTPGPITSIAVLPFANMSADENSVYFSDGLADTVLHMLAEVPGLRVAARTSSFQFRDQTLDVAKIGEQLNVGTILEGSVQKSGDKIRVTAQLIDVSSGFHLWSDSFDRNLDDVFSIQDEIASEVVAALKVKLLGEDVERLNVGQTDNVDAYTEYLLAVNDLNNVSTENLKSAVNHLQEAIRLDPKYAQAYSALGRAYLSLEGWGAMNTTEALAVARKAATRALDIYADSSEALAVLGLAELLDGTLESAGQLLNKAIENSPNDVVALDYYALYLHRDARPDEAIAIYRQILRLDPLSESAHTGLAWMFGRARRYSEASETIDRFLVIQPESVNAHGIRFFIELWQGNWAAAIAPTTDPLVLYSDDPEGPGWHGHVYMSLDMPAEASRLYDRAVEIDAQHPVSRAAPLWLNYYHQKNEEENYRLARKLLEDRVSDRPGTDRMALNILIEHAARTGRHEAALELLDNIYPHLFDDPPHDLDKDRPATYFSGLALINSGDVDRGSHLMRSYLELSERHDEAYGVNRRSVAGALALGDTDTALDKLAGFAQNKYFMWENRLLLERSPLFDTIREEPAFIALLDEYRENAAEQRQILQAMKENTSSP